LRFGEILNFPRKCLIDHVKISFKF
jgi:hypothetical protein